MSCSDGMSRYSILTFAEDSIIIKKQITLSKQLKLILLFCTIDQYKDQYIVLAEPGQICQEQGLSIIDTKEDCRSLLVFVQSQYPDMDGNTIYEEHRYEEYPKGCYFSIILGGLFFNNHLHGKSNNTGRQVCKNIKGKFL